MNRNEIPEITNELGRFWDQPKREEILIDDTHAVMSMRNFQKLHIYNSSQPSGVYIGKMWGMDIFGQRKLIWFGYSEMGEKFCSVNSRDVLIVD